MIKFFNLKNKIVLVTGASGFIGSHVVKCLLREKCRLILILHNKKSQNKINSLAKNKYISIFYADLNNEDELDLALLNIKKSFNHIDGIINFASASSGLGSSKYKNKLSKFSSAINNNLIGPIKIVLTLRNLLKKNKTLYNSSSVINVSSIYGTLSPDQNIYKNSKFVNPLDYGCSKAAQIQMTKYFANDKILKKIRFNNLILGPFPNQNKNFREQIYKDKLLKKIPIGRFGIPDDIVGAIFLLLSAKSSFMNGSSITIDGGWSSN
jgi:NAD(P)-dependent dehydrogenase (short-subunit alcohol dehydrogenase family)